MKRHRGARYAVATDPISFSHTALGRAVKRKFEEALAAVGDALSEEDLMCSKSLQNRRASNLTDVTRGFF